MFVSNAITLDVSFDMALARLVSLERHGLLARASAQAYARGLADIFGCSLTGESRLAGAHTYGLQVREGRRVLALRWEAATVADGVTPVLDADITLIPTGTDGALLHLTGVYRPYGRLLGDDPAWHQVAAVTVKAFLDRVTGAIARPLSAWPELN